MSDAIHERLHAAAEDVHRVAAEADTEAMLQRFQHRVQRRWRLGPAVALAGVAAMVVAVVVTGVVPGAPRPIILGDTVQPATESPARDPSVSRPSTSASTSPAETCSASSLPRDVSDQPGLPAAVGQMRTRLAALAAACDVDGLADLAADEQFTHSFGGQGDPAAAWRRWEAEATPANPGPMEALRRILEATPGRVETASVGHAEYWVWPRLHLLDPEKTPAPEVDAAIDEVVATGLYTRDELETMLAGGSGYLGYRIIIELAEGATSPNWIVFVAGD